MTQSEFKKLFQEEKVNDLVITVNIIREKLEKGAVDIIPALRGAPSGKERLKA